MNGPARITRQDIRQWEADEGARLDHWERRAILDLDALWFEEVVAKPAERKR